LGREEKGASLPAERMKGRSTWLLRIRRMDKEKNKRRSAPLQQLSKKGEKKKVFRWSDLAPRRNQRARKTV